MQGLDKLNSLSRESVKKILGLMYETGMYDTALMEDTVLFTEGRVDFPNIGTDAIRLSTMMYLMENSYWINVCLFVNEDFRACFDDAIMIEKALLQVNDLEYQDFRDDMTLDDKDAPANDRNVPINLSRYNDKMEMAIISKISSDKQSARQLFFQAGMMDVYEDLMHDFDRKTEESVSYTIHNFVYVINAMNRNGVFCKYVKLVVDSVKKQLS